MSSKHMYQGSLQERLRNLSLRTNCPTRQENGQRYLGPPVDWIEKPPSNSEIFISKLPADCYEDEIYDFCSQVGKIYLIRLMINFENENRGFCFVTFSSSKEASEAVAVLPQNSLRKGHYVHAEISFNNCTLKMYGLDFRWNDENLEQEIRTNTKDVVNVTIKRNMAQRTLMATLYFDTHQKAAIARRKLSQIANSRWGQNVKVFLWSKKLQNKGVGKQESSNEKNCSRKKSEKIDENSPQKDFFKRDYEFDSMHRDNNDNYSEKSFADNSPFQEFSPWNSSIFSPPKQHREFTDNYFKNDLIFKPDNVFDSKDKSIEQLKQIDAALKAYDSSNFDVFSTNDNPLFTAFGTPPGNSFSSYMSENQTNSLFPISNESSPGGYSKSSTSDSDIFGFGGVPNWNCDFDFLEPTPARSQSNEPVYKNDFAHSLYANLPEKQIETILQEALQALTLNKCDEQKFFL